MVWLGLYKQVFETHGSSFRKSGYSENEGFVSAPVIVALKLPECALIHPARYFGSAIPRAETLLEFEQPDGISLKVISALRWKCSMFSAAVVSESKTWAMGKVHDEGYSSYRIQQFDCGRFQVGSFRAITLKAICRSVRLTRAA